METVNVTINGQNRNIGKMLLSELLFGSSYFTNSISTLNKSIIEIQGISCQSVEIFFDFIENQTRFTNQQEFIKSYEKTHDQVLYELLIIFDYFNSSLSNLVCIILENKTSSTQDDIKQIEIYVHINNMLDNIILRRRTPLKFIIKGGTVSINTSSVNFYINQPYLTEINEWREFLNKIKNNKVGNIYFGWLHINYETNHDCVNLYCECRGGLGGDGFLNVSVSCEEFCIALEDFLNSDKFTTIYNF